MSACHRLIVVLSQQLPSTQRRSGRQSSVGPATTAVSGPTSTSCSMNISAIYKIVVIVIIIKGEPTRSRSTYQLTALSGIWRPKCFCFFVFYFQVNTGDENGGLSFQRLWFMDTFMCLPQHFSVLYQPVCEIFQTVK